MILFTPHHGIKEALLYYRPDDYNFYEFNLSSPINYGYSLAPLIPDPEYIPYEVVNGSIDTPDFDVMYGNFIMNNRDQFLLFMKHRLENYQFLCLVSNTNHINTLLHFTSEIASNCVFYHLSAYCIDTDFCFIFHRNI